MATQKFSNNFSTRLSQGIVASDLVVPLLTTTGLPVLTGGDTCKLTLVRAVDSVREIVLVTGINTVTKEVTVTRGQEATLPATFSAGDTVELRMTADSINDITFSVAEVMADITATEANIEASETAAAASAAAASTSESNAATSESNASTSASNASASELNAGTSETNAGTSESNAGTSASNASTSETNAATSESNASTSASTATTKAAEASASAANAAGSVQQMTKSEFFAKSELNKAMLAGSGFVEWGQHYNNSSSTPEVNQGLWTLTTAINEFRLAHGASVATNLESRTEYPIVNVAGTAIKMYGTRSASVNDINRIYFPDAPTANQLVTNGTFDTGDTSSFIIVNGSTITVSSNRLEVTNATALNGGISLDVTGMVSGQEYLIEFEAALLVGAAGVNLYVNNALTQSSVQTGNTIRETFVYNGVNAPLIRYAGGGQLATDKFYVDNVSIIATADLSRQDLVFLETWHENISDKDWVAPLGNVQYGATSFDGITLTNTVGNPAAGYSAFGEWESSPTVGYGAVWSNLSDADQKKFLADPYNNIYLDDTGELVQVRYRIRVIYGLGDDWENVETDSLAINSTYAPFGYNADATVRPQGMLTAPIDNLYDGAYFYLGQNETSGLATEVGVGHYALRDNYHVTYGNCVAVPIALVQRRALAAYHPVFAPFGCGVFSDGNLWYNTTDTVSSTLDCLP